MKFLNYSMTEMRTISIYFVNRRYEITMAMNELNNLTVIKTPYLAL